MVQSQIAPFISLLVTVAVAIVAVGVLGFVAAKRFGGQSRAKRQLVFLLVSAVGFLILMGYVYLRLRPHG